MFLPATQSEYHQIATNEPVVKAVSFFLNMFNLGIPVRARVPHRGGRALHARLVHASTPCVQQQNHRPRVRKHECMKCRNEVQATLGLAIAWTFLTLGGGDNIRWFKRRGYNLHRIFFGGGLDGY